MHEPIRLPPSDHPYVSPRNFQYQLCAPRISRIFYPIVTAPAYVSQLEDAARDPLPEDAKRVEVGLLLASTKEKDLRGRVERLE